MMLLMLIMMVMVMLMLMLMLIIIINYYVDDVNGDGKSDCFNGGHVDDDDDIDVDDNGGVSVMIVCFYHG